MRRDPEIDARKMLEAVWTKESPSELRLPVDPFYIAKAQGISVYGEKLDPDISGMLRKLSSSGDPEIVLNVNDHRNRQRFTCAHELGHYNMRTQSLDFEAWNFVDRRDTLAGAGTDPDEIYANQFAAALLMPESAVKKLWAEQKEVATLAYSFGVSAEAMALRLKNLRLL